MTTEQTITIHHEPPPVDSGREGIMAYNIHRREYEHVRKQYAALYWSGRYSAWYDPQVGEPVKPRRFVVEQTGETWAVYHMPHRACFACLIPTRSAAEAIADIYERAAEGGEA